VQAVTPLICRDAASFLKAAATTVCIELKEPKGTTENSMVVLLTPEQSARNSRALANVLSSKDASVSDATEVGHDKRGTKASNNTKSPRHKVERRPTSSKRPNMSKKKKERTEFSSCKKSTPLNGTPANHVTCLLIARVVALASHQPDMTNEVTDGQSGISTSDGASVLENRAHFFGLQIFSRLWLILYWQYRHVRRPSIDIGPRVTRSDLRGETRA
jgi:hypothetical protein